MSVTVNESNYTVTINETTQTVQVASPGPAGQGVATGGTTGQSLVKLSGSNYHTGWSDAGSGTVTQIVAGTGLSGGTITSSGTISLPNSGVSAGDYTNANITVDAQGRVTVAASGTAGGVTSLTGGNLIDVDASTGAVTIDHAPKGASGVTTTFPGSIIVDSFGHVVSAGASAPPAQLANNLSDLANKDTAITNLGGTAVGSAVFKAADAAAARTAIGAGTGSGDVVAANNLSDLANAGTARTNLGLGSSATLDVPSSGDAASGEVVKGNDTRLTDARTPVNHSAALITSGTLAIAQGGTGSATAPMVGVITAADAAAARTVLGAGTGNGDLLASNNLSEVTDSTARTNLGLGNAAILDTGIGNTDLLKCGANVSQSDFLRINALSELVEGRTNAEVLSDIGADNASNLTSGTIPTARIDTGTTANKIVVLDGSARLPAVDGSQLTNISGGGGGTDYTMAPISQTWRYFDDFLAVTPDRGGNNGNNQFWMYAGGSGITPQDNDFTGGRGIAMHSVSSDNRRYSYWGAKILNGFDETDGDELFWESRLYFIDSTATAGYVRLGVAEQINSLNYNDNPPGPGYTTFRHSTISVDLGNTNIVTAYNTATPPQNSVETDLGSSYPVSSYVDTWFRLGIHAKYNAADSDWDIAYYINGASVGTMSMTFTQALVPFVGCGVGTANGTCVMNNDWISYQGNIGTDTSGRTTRIDIGDI